MSAIRKSAWRLLRSEVFRAYEGSEQDGRNDPEQAEIRRRAHLRALISDAARNIPFYREHWRGCGLLAAAERGEVELSDLPPLSRDHLRESLSLLERPGLSGAEVVRRSTGGSSGQPVRFTLSRGYLSRASGRGLRCLSWGGWILGSRTALVWGGPNELRFWQGMRGRIKALVTNQRMFDAFRAGEQEYAGWLRVWQRWRPQFVIGYASALDAVSRYMLRSGQRLTGVDAVFSTAEKLYPEQRERIAQAFSAPVRDHYGSREVLSVASECVHGRMHAYQDSAYLELLPGPGGAGQIALTQFDNPAMPLVRYLNGDMARWADARTACPCGLHYPVLAEVVGRVSDMFRFSQGRVVHGEYFTHLMYDVEGVESFQYYQAPDSRVTLYVVPSCGKDAAGLRHELGEVVSSAKAGLGLDISIDVQVVGDIPKRGQGKHRYTISEVET